MTDDKKVAEDKKAEKTSSTTPKTTEVTKK